VDENYLERKNIFLSDKAEKDFFKEDEKFKWK
jgi:hypothetical protein